MIISFQTYWLRRALYIAKWKSNMRLQSELERQSSIFLLAAAQCTCRAKERASSLHAPKCYTSQFYICLSRELQPSKWKMRDKKMQLQWTRASRNILRFSSFSIKLRVHHVSTIKFCRQYSRRKCHDHRKVQVQIRKINQVSWECSATQIFCCRS